MTLNKKIKILLVEDRDIIRDLFKLMFAKDDFIKITGEAEDGLEAIELVKKNDYDVIIMDINMPNLNGLETTKKIKEYNPKSKILAHSFHQNNYYIQEMIRAGASGYIMKGESVSEYREAIWTIFNSGIYLSDEIDNSIYDRVLRGLKYPPSSLLLV
jgi:two-component system response regulator DegU